MTLPVHSRNSERGFPRTVWLRCALAAVAAALFLCLSTVVDHQIPQPVQEAQTGSITADAWSAPVRTALGAHPAGEAHCGPQTHHQAVVTAQTQSEVQPSRQPPATIVSNAEPTTIVLTANTIAPDLHVLQVLRT
ncbi:hypothetical protein [Streptomyces albipurpureus]|uniref:Secreted protein n=1 Tax=Streptomyces albipurpureus TaxID=2897419 RepID=A0ABT0UHK1_9ACTN|nr:hypothetical protein [Streptomyces sp. CWNU-1]MCM2387651.1 hypothetical protein [Streptomyces sp. CWNU-1]